MTREECKDILVDKINHLFGVRVDEFAAWGHLYQIPGFSETFHPDILQQLVAENRITTIEYSVGGNKLTFLLPKDTVIKVFNGKVE